MAMADKEATTLKQEKATLLSRLESGASLSTS